MGKCVHGVPDLDICHNCQPPPKRIYEGRDSVSRAWALLIVTAIVGPLTYGIAAWRKETIETLMGYELTWLEYFALVAR